MSEPTFEPPPKNPLANRMAPDPEHDSARSEAHATITSISSPLSVGQWTTVSLGRSGDERTATVPERTEQTIQAAQTLAPPAEETIVPTETVEAVETAPLVTDAVTAAVIEPVPVGELGPTGRPMPVFPDPAPLSQHGGATVIAMGTQKGGVGQTTTTITLGASLAEYGRKVLLVDFDPQASLTVGLGINPNDLDTTIYHLMLGNIQDVDEIVLPTGVEGMDLIPSNIDFAGAEMQLINEVAREQVLARALAPFVEKYDVILIDCQPSLGLLTVHALAASDGVLIPLECEYFALRGVALLKGTIDKVQERLNPRLEIVGLLGTMYDGRTLHSREVLQTLVDGWGDAVFHTVIRRTVKFSEATVAGEPLTAYATASAGADSYRQLAREVLERRSQGSRGNA